jgi:hypothetical protein
MRPLVLDAFGQMECVNSLADRENHAQNVDYDPSEIQELPAAVTPLEDAFGLAPKQLCTFLFLTRFTGNRIVPSLTIPPCPSSPTSRGQPLPQNRQKRPSAPTPSAESH